MPSYGGRQYSLSDRKREYIENPYIGYTPVDLSDTVQYSTVVITTYSQEKYNRSPVPSYVVIPLVYPKNTMTNKTVKIFMLVV